MPLTVKHLDGPFVGRIQTFDDDVESIKIGRDPNACQIVLDIDARMAGREHCTLSRIRGRYLIDMDADRRVTLDGWQMLESGTPIPDSCELQIGPGGPKLKFLVTRHSQMESTADQQIDESDIARRASPAATELDMEAVAQDATGSRRIGLFAGVGAAVAIVAGLIFFVVTRGNVEALQVSDAEQTDAIDVLDGRADEMEDDLIVLGADLPEIMLSARDSVYLIIYQGADGGETGIGTAFVVAPGTVATNAHVAKWVGRLEAGEGIVLRSPAIEGQDSIDIPVLGAALHPGYDAFADLWQDYVPVRLNASKGIDPVRSAGSACDLATLTVAASAPLGPVLPLATEVHQRRLAPGHAVASVGFPMEGMAMEGVNVVRPVPQSQIGRVTSLTTFFNTSEDETDWGPGQRNILLQHSIPGTGGSSGSPILNGAGEVVGVLSAVNFAIVDGQRIPTGVGVNYAQRSTLLQELLNGTADNVLAQRLALWSDAVQLLYHSGRLVQGTGDMDTLIAIWRRQMQDRVGGSNVMLTRRQAYEFFPLASLEAGRIAGGNDGSEGYLTDVDFEVISGHWYFLVAESDGVVSVDLDDPDGLASELLYIPLGDTTQGVAFQATADGQITGIIESTGDEQVAYSIEEGESVAAVPENLLRLARDQWRADLLNRWGADVRDSGGLQQASVTATEGPDGRFYEIEQMTIDGYGRYMIVVIAPDRTNVDLRLWQVEGDERTMLGEDMQDDWFPYLILDTDFGLELEAEVIADAADVEYELYFYRAMVKGDTDSDDNVLVPDLINVAIGFGKTSEDGDLLPEDMDEDGTVDVDDLLAVISNFKARWPTDAGEQPNRLLNMCLIGGSWPDGVAEIHPQAFTLEDGWNKMVDVQLTPLVDALGDGSFDWWGHNPAGYWRDHDYHWSSSEIAEPMTFEQLMFARQEIPKLVDFSPLSTFGRAHGIQLYGYVGMPRSYDAGDTPCGLPFDIDWDHGNVDRFNDYYKEFVDNNFVGIGHDASIHQPHDSTWLNTMVPELQDNGIEVFVESIPKRTHPHLLGQNVIAEHRVWTNFGNYPTIWYSEDEIKAAGARTVHLMSWPFGQGPGDGGYDPDFNVHDWQFNTAKALLEQGEDVLIPLYPLYIRDYPLQDLVNAASRTANVHVQ